MYTNLSAVGTGDIDFCGGFDLHTTKDTFLLHSWFIRFCTE